MQEKKILKKLEEKKMSKLSKFIITEDHIKLLKRLFFFYDESAYDGAPAVDPKRPYGNSAVHSDICEIVGLPEPCEECGTNEESFHTAQRLHEEMVIVLQIICCTASVKTGTYIKKDEYNDLSWELKE